MSKKKTYSTPTVEVVEVELEAHLLTGSGLGVPTGYPGGGNPLGS